MNALRVSGLALFGILTLLIPVDCARTFPVLSTGLQEPAEL